MVASESVALDTLGFEFLRDVAPGEAVYVTEQGQLFTRMCAENPQYNPCLFEFVYFARPDSFIDKISVYSARRCPYLPQLLRFLSSWGRVRWGEDKLIRAQLFVPFFRKRQSVMFLMFLRRLRFFSSSLLISTTGRFPLRKRFLFLLEFAANRMPGGDFALKDC